MPDRTYWDLTKLEKVELNSDYFRCPRCQFDKFEYKSNPDFFSGASDKKYRQLCKGCGEVILSDDRYMLQRSRYILYSEYLKTQKKGDETKEKKG
jgi:uncharacterized protein with PIN domain